MVVQLLLSALLLALLGVFVAGIAGWVYVGYQRAQGATLPTFVPRRPVPWGLAEFLVLFGLWLLGPVVVTRQLMRRGLLTEMPEAAASAAPEAMAAWMGIAAGTQLAILLLGTAAFIAIGHIRIDDLGVGLHHLKRFAVVGLFGSILILPVIFIVQTIAVQFVEYEHPLLEILEEKAGFGLFLTAAGVAVIVAPICEELLFRVFLQGWLENLSGRTVASPLAAIGAPPQPLEGTSVADHDIAAESEPIPYQPTDEVHSLGVARTLQPGYWPIFVSSVLFAGLHLGQGPAPIALFFMGLGLGYLYRQTHSLWPSLIVHVLLNGITICVTFLTSALPADSPLAPPPADGKAASAIVMPAAPAVACRSTDHL